MVAVGMLAPVIAYLGMDITGFRAGAAESKTIMRGLSGEQGTSGLSKSFKALGAVATAGAIAIGVASIHMAADFQTNMTKLVTSAGETKANLGLVSDGVLKLAVDTGTSTDQLSQGLYMVESAGYHGAAGLDVLKASAQGARAEGADLAEVTNAVTSGLNAYHLPASQATAVTDEFVAAVGSGKMTMQDFASSVGALLPVAAAAHLSIPQVTGALATWTMAGTSAQEASQNLAFAIRALQAPSTVAQQAMAAVGLSSTDLAQNLGNRGLTGTLAMVSEAILQHMGPDGLVLLHTFNDSKQAAQSLNTMLTSMPTSLRAVSEQFMNGQITASAYSKEIKKLPVDQQVLGQNFEALVKRTDGFTTQLKNGSSSSQTFTAALSKIMGGATGLNAALMLTGGNAKSFNDNVNTIANAAKGAGADVNGWSDITGTFNFKLSQLKETVQTTGIRIGTVLIPAVEASVGFFARHQTAALALAAVIGGVLLASMINFGVATVATTAKGAVFLAQAIATTVADWAETAALAAMYAAEGIASAATAVLDAVMDANPIVLVVGALVALGAAVYEAYQHITPFRDLVQSAFHVIGDTASWLWHNMLEPAFHGIATAATWMWDNALKPVVDAVVFGFGLLVDAGKIVASVFDAVFHGVAAVVSYTWDNVLHPVIGFIVALIKLQLVVALWLLEKTAEQVWKAISAVALWAWNNVLKPTWDALVGETRALGMVAMWLWDNAFQPALQAIGQAALWLYHNAIEPAWHGIGDAVSAAWTGVIKPAYDAVKSGIDDLKTGALSFWHDGIEPAWHGIGGVISDVWNNAIKPVFDTIKQYIDDIVGGLNKVVGMGKSVFNAGTSAVNKITSLFHFADGGWVPGAVGAAQLAVVHGGEYVLSRDMINGNAPIDPGAIASTAGSLGGAPAAAGGTGGGSAGGGGNVIVVVQGSLLQTDRQLVDTLSELFAADGRRNGVTYPTFST